MLRKTAGLAAGLMLSVVSTFAQELPPLTGPAGMPPPGARPHAGQLPGGPAHDPLSEYLFPPELIMAHQKAIGLDDAQKNAIRSEILKTQTRFTELQWQLQDAIESLASVLKNSPVDEQQVLGQLDKVLNFEREIKRAQLGLMVRIKNKLTPEQQARLRELRGSEWGPPTPPAAPAPLPRPPAG